MKTIPAAAIALLLAACGGGGSEEQAVSASQQATAPVAAEPSAPPAAQPAPPVAQPPAATPPVAQPPRSEAPRPVDRPAEPPVVAAPAPQEPPPPAPPVAAPETIKEYLLHCRETPFYDGQPVEQVVISINGDAYPWKWLRAEGTLSRGAFATDPDGQWAANNPNPPYIGLIGDGTVRPALYGFDDSGVKEIMINNNGGKYDFPTVCQR